MRYQGSKAKMVKSVLKKLIEDNISENTCYIEPFSGGFNCIGYIDAKHKVANDINQYTVALWKDIRDNGFVGKYETFLSNLTKDQYKDIYDDYKKNGSKYPDSIKGYVGFSCSNSSGWWKGYANYNEKKKENHIKEAFDNLKKHVDNFINISSCDIFNKSYDELDVPYGSFIYCDPPYESTEGYKVGFDNKKFWDWCRMQSEKGNKVLISEFTAPDDFVCIWSKTMQNGYGTKSSDKVEKLFIHKSQVSSFVLHSVA